MAFVIAFGESLIHFQPILCSIPDSFVNQSRYFYFYPFLFRPDFRLHRPPFAAARQARRADYLWENTFLVEMGAADVGCSPQDFMHNTVLPRPGPAQGVGVRLIEPFGDGPYC